METRGVIERYWALMRSNDFGAVGAVLSPDFELCWPQSGERIRGAANYAAMNQHYPASGLWRFEQVELLVEGERAVSVMDVSDGTTQGRAISCFEVAAGRIRRIVEYWPDPFPAPDWRRRYVEDAEPSP